MVTKVTTHCDRCKEEITDKYQIWNVMLIVENSQTMSYSMNLTRSYPRIQEEWCRKCCETFRVLPNNTLPKEEVRPEPVTLEDLIRELIRDEIVDRTGAC